MVRGLAVCLLFAFVLLTPESTRSERVSERVVSATSSARAPDRPRPSVERLGAKLSVAPHPSSRIFGVLSSSQWFELRAEVASFPEFSSDWSSSRLIDRRALIRRLGRVQHRPSPAPRIT